MNRRKFLMGALCFGVTTIVLKEFGTDMDQPVQAQKQVGADKAEVSAAVEVSAKPVRA